MITLKLRCKQMNLKVVKAYSSHDDGVTISQLVSNILSTTVLILKVITVMPIKL